MLDQLQTELSAEHPQLDISILGVNQAGFESGNEAICDGRDIPWLQDVSQVDVWSTWGVTYRDVIVLDGDNVPFGVFNVTSNSLADQANWDTLKQLFLDAAAE